MGFVRLVLVDPAGEFPPEPVGRLYFTGAELDRLALERILEAWPHVASQEGYRDRLLAVPVEVPDV